MVSPTRGLTREGPDCFQAEVAVRPKVGIRPTGVGQPVAVAVAARASQKDTSESPAYESVHVAEGPADTVLEVTKPTGQRRVHIDDDHPQAFPGVTPRLRSQGVFELLHALRPRPTRQAAPTGGREMVAEKIKALLANVDDAGLRWVQRQAFGFAPRTYKCQCVFRLGLAAAEE